MRPRLGRALGLGLGLGLLGCAGMPDGAVRGLWGPSEADQRIAELDARIAEVEAQRPALREAERQAVAARIAAAQQEGGEGPELEALLEMGRELGVEGLPDPSPWRPAPLDGRQVGVTQAHGAAVLEGVRSELHVAVDEVAWGAAAAQALGADRAPTPEGAIADAVAKGVDESEAVVIGVEAALHAVDPYTKPVWPAQVQAWSQHHAGVTVGVGLSLDVQRADGAVSILALDPYGPAWGAGAHVGDVLLRVDGAEVMGLADARARVAGEAGSEVSLDVLRGAEELPLALTRQALPVRTVFGWRRMGEGDLRSATHQLDVPEVDPGVQYVRITSFVPDTDEQLGEQASHGPYPAVVLDLRGNPGGDVQAALNVADAWFDDGVLLHMAGRAAPVPDPPAEGEAAWNEATPGGAFVGRCTVVLVDDQTASAAEIVAGVLQQRAGATVIGAPTAGKAVSQALRADEGLGVAWQVTNLAWALPDGTQLVAGQGVRPDVLAATRPAEAWQIARQAAMRQAPRHHADGSPMPYLGPAVGEGFPELVDDPVLLVARRWVQANCFGG